MSPTTRPPCVYAAEERILVAMPNPRNRMAALLTAAAVCFTPGLVRAIEPGDILVADTRNGIYYFDHVTGNQHQLTGMNRGSGFFDVASDAAGNIYATSVLGGVYRIDPQAGNQTLVAEIPMSHTRRRSK